MNQAEKMRQLANETIYHKYKSTIDQIMELIEKAAKDGQYKISLSTTEFPEAGCCLLQTWFRQSGFQIVTYEWDSAQKHKINICWGMQ